MENEVDNCNHIISTSQSHMQSKIACYEKVWDTLPPGVIGTRGNIAKYGLDLPEPILPIEWMKSYRSLPNELYSSKMNLSESSCISSRRQIITRLDIEDEIESELEQLNIRKEENHIIDDE